MRITIPAVITLLSTIPLVAASPSTDLGAAVTALERSIGRIERDIRGIVAARREKDDERGAEAWLTVRRHLVDYRDQVRLTRRLLALLDLVTEDEKREEGHGIVTDFCRTCIERTGAVRRYADNAVKLLAGDEAMLDRVDKVLKDGDAAFNAFIKPGTAATRGAE